MNSIYFQAIQTAVFYQKNTYKKFRPNFLMFLDHRVSCDQNKSWSLGKIDYWKVPQKVGSMNKVKKSDIFMFFVLFSNIFLRVFQGHFKGTFWWIWEHNILTVFINFNLDFGVLAQKFLKPCVNGVLKFQFFFLNLSSKFLAGVRVGTSIYPYMDICEMNPKCLGRFVEPHPIDGDLTLKYLTGLLRMWIPNLSTITEKTNAWGIILLFSCHLRSALAFANMPV